MRLVFSLVFSIVMLASNAFKAPTFFQAQQLLNDTLNSLDIKVDFNIKSQASGTNDVTHYYGIQTFQNLEVEATEFNLSIKNGKIIHLNQRFVQKIESKIQHQNFNLSPKSALQLRYPQSNLGNISLEFTDQNSLKFEILDLSDEPITITKVLALNKEKYVAAYEISLYQKDGSHWYNTNIDAKTGEILNESDWVTQCNIDIAAHRCGVAHQMAAPISAAQQETHTSDESYRIFAIPIESPNHGDRTLVVNPAESTASPFGWHDVNGVDGAEYTITRGNNVYAYEDRAGNNQVGYSPDGGNNLLFDFDFDKNKSHHLYLDAAITNLFYLNNMMHDVWYHYGFDETSGNFQQNNYSKGGRDNDFVRAEAQDGSGTNNANFATPPDGNSPRMQMFLWGNNIGRFYLQITYANGTSGLFNSVPAIFGAQPSSDAVDGDLFHISGTNPGCSQISDDLTGKMALIERGGCTFIDKVRNAQNAGAKGVVVFQNSGDEPFAMPGTNSLINIPSVMISRANGLALVNMLNTQSLLATIKDTIAASGSNIYDSDFDNGIIAHEYGHGISNRLTGGALASSCLNNEEQMGEGWSDFFSLVMTHNHDRNPNGTVALGIGTYPRNQPINGRGIRTFSYSTNMQVSPYVYENIKTLSIPHGVGSVWCAMLWDLYWAFIDEYAYDSDIYKGTGGNNMAMQLVMDGMKYQNCRPGFVDGRDAILLADEINNNGKNAELIWKVFARRGLGYSASQGASTSRADGTQSFDLPPILPKELRFAKTAPFEVNGNKITYTLTIDNKSSDVAENIVIYDTLPKNTQFVSSSSTCPVEELGNGVIRFILTNIPKGEKNTCTYDLNHLSTNTANVLFSDNGENENTWQNVTVAGTHSWALAAIRVNKGSKSWFAPNQGNVTDYQLIRDFNLTDIKKDVIFSFFHFYNTDRNRDGGVIEIFADNKWIDASPYLLTHGYNGALSESSIISLRGRAAYTGASNGFVRTIMNLTPFKGQNIKIRFRFLSDESIGLEGWHIDQMELIETDMVVNKASLTYAQSENPLFATAISFADGALSKHKLQNDFEIKLFPNPFNDRITIQSKGSFEYGILDVSGRALKSGTGDNETHISLEYLPAGIYFVEILSGQHRKVYKISKLTSH